MHNLSYDIVYLLKFLRIYLGNETNSIILKSHSVLSCTFGNLEFRCSYLLTGYSLNKCCDVYKSRHKKLTGTIDYSVLRYQDSKLEFKDDLYMVNDVISLHEIITHLIKEKNGRLDNLPLTKTGYVRVYCRQKAKEDKKNRKMFVDTQLTYEQYIKFKSAFAGGYTHSNYQTRGKLVTGNIRHFDFRSHYPSVMMLEKFPVGKFKTVKMTKTELKNNYEFYSYLLTVLVYRCELKHDKRFSYISATLQTANNIINDNGRIYKTDSEFLMYCTYEDLQIIDNLYNIDYKIVSVEYAEKDYLPLFMRDSIKNFMYDKTKYKILEREAKNDVDKFDYKIMLLNSKNLINSLYGMCATNILRDTYNIDLFGDYVKEDISINEKVEKLEKYYKSRNSFLPYQWSLWVTSYARKYLFDVFDILEHKNVLYADTDSAFTLITSDKQLDDINNYNKRLYEKAIETDSYITYNDKIVNFGAFEDEQEEITKFKALHSKCYMFECDGKLNSVIAGVVSSYKDDNNKVHNNTEECDSFEKFDDGFVFSEKFGGTTCKYINNPPTHEYINNHLIEYSDCAIIEKITKEIHNNFDEL